MPVNRSRPGRTSTERSRCSIAHAVWYEPISNARWTLNADTPSFCAANIQQTVNHTVSGERRRSNSVPAVTAVRDPHAPHLNPPSATAHPPDCAHRGQAKPPGQRNHSR